VTRTVPTVIRRLVATTMASAVALAVFVSPVSAHGDHDARPLARSLAAGPYTISVWQVYPDSATAMTPHLIVMFDGVRVWPKTVDVHVTVNGRSLDVVPSTTTANGLETMEGVAEGDSIRIGLSEGAAAWDLDAIVVPPPATSVLPMEELLYWSIFLTIGTAWWVVRRTARAWRRPIRREPQPVS
jgi:hypothetical protein